MHHSLEVRGVASSPARVVLAGLTLLAAAGCKDTLDPPNPVIDTSINVPSPSLVKTIAFPPPVGIHDTFIRDGILFVCAWNNGLIIYDVGDGRSGGSVANPVEISRIVTATNGTPGPEVHNAWWFHNPVSGEKRYVFVGQEGPSTIGFSSTGDIHVVDVQDMSHPQEVAFYHMGVTPAAGTHNFWMDESAQILYAAYYNGGVVALDVSGTLTGDLASRELARIRPASSTYTWGVQLSGNSLYASDMYNGLYQLRYSGGSFSVLGGGTNVTERFSSDLWVNGSYAYTGTWGGPRVAGVFGNALKTWHLNANGAPPVSPDSVIITGIQTVSDVKGSTDGKLLVVSAERGAAAGLYLFGLNDPAHPNLVGRTIVGDGLHTAKVADIGGKRYVFAAKNSGSSGGPALHIYDVTGF